MIEFDDYVTQATVEQTLAVLADKTLAQQMASTNFELAKHYYSYDVLKTKLKILLANAFGTNEVL